MSIAWVAVGSAVVGAGSSIYGSKKAADASKKAANVSAEAAQSELAYLQEINALPQQYKEAALNKLAGVAGLEGGEGSQQDLIDKAQQSPLYASLMQGQKAGEEAILRTGSATGGLRSGNTIDAIADDAEQRRTDALLQSYNQQQGLLQGLSGLQTNELQIGNVMSSIGNIRAQGIQAAGQAQQQGFQGIADSIGGAAGLYAKYKI